MSIMLPLVTDSWALSDPLNNVKKIGLSLDSCLIALQFPADCSISASWMSCQLLMSYWTIMCFSGANWYPQLFTLKLCCKSFCTSQMSTLAVSAVNRGWLCQWPLTLAVTCNLGLEILVWGTDLSFIPCGLGLCTNLSCVNWQWFQNLLGRWVDLCPGNFAEFCEVSSCTHTCSEREGRESHKSVYWQITYCLYKYKNLKVYEIVQTEAVSIETNTWDGKGLLCKWFYCHPWVRLSVVDSHVQKNFLLRKNTEVEIASKISGKTRNDQAW